LISGQIGVVSFGEIQVIWKSVLFLVKYTSSRLRYIYIIENIDETFHHMHAPYTLSSLKIVEVATNTSVVDENAACNLIVYFLHEYVHK
jgi:hypothetical protein